MPIRSPTRLALAARALPLFLLLLLPRATSGTTVWTLGVGKDLLRLDASERGAIHVQLLPGGRERAQASFVTPGARERGPEGPASAKEDPKTLTISTPQGRLVVQKKPLLLRFEDQDGRLLNEDARPMAFDGAAPRVWKKMPVGEHYFGFGEKASSTLDRRGSHMTMWNTDAFGYRPDTDPIYQSVPFFMGVRAGKAYGILFDNTHWSTFDMGKTSPVAYSFGASGGPLDYWFFFGPEPKAVIEAYTRLAGHMPLPPRWALGYQQCRWSYPSDKRVREVAHEFRARKIPADVIYLDIDYMDGYRIFTWNGKTFPDPTRLIADLGRQGWKVVVIVDPGIKVDPAYPAYVSGHDGGHFLTTPDGREYVGKVWPGSCAFPDFTQDKTRAWWAAQLGGLVKLGVRGLWTDMNEPSVFDVPSKTVDLSSDGSGLVLDWKHNVYGQQMSRATYQGALAAAPRERPFVLTRASFAGGQRWAAAWTGDNTASWEHLAMSIPMFLNVGLSGQPFIGSDIGGFAGNPSPELFARWLELGVFTPLMRGHSIRDANDKEPWAFGPEMEKVNRQTIALRYRMLPLIYTVMTEASMTGLPAMRPLFLEFPDDERLYGEDTAFMFGRDLLVAPVLEDGARKRTVRLPAGDWFDFWTGRRRAGGASATVDAAIDRLPIFVRAGAILPSQQPVQWSDEKPIDPLTFTVYPADAPTGEPYYEDDGHSLDYQDRGAVLVRTLTQTTRPEARTLTLSAPLGKYVPPRRGLEVRFVDVAGSPRSVEANGQVVDTWRYDAESRTVRVTLPEDRMAAEEIMLRLR